MTLELEDPSVTLRPEEIGARGRMADEDDAPALDATVPKIAFAGALPVPRDPGNMFISCRPAFLSWARVPIGIPILDGEMGSTTSVQQTMDVSKMCYLSFIDRH